MGDSTAAGSQQNQPQGQKAVDIMALLWDDPTISARCVLLILYYIL